MDTHQIGSHQSTIYAFTFLISHEDHSSIPVVSIVYSIDVLFVFGILKNSVGDSPAGVGGNHNAI